METGKWREIRTLGAGSKDFQDKINTRTSCGVRVGSVVGAVPVEAVVVVVGGRAGSAVLAAAGVERATGAAEALVVFFFRGAIFKISCWWYRSLGLKRTSWKS